MTDEKLDAYVYDALGALTGDYYDDEDLGEHAGSSSSSSASLGVILGAVFGSLVFVALAITGYSIYHKSSRSAKVGSDGAVMHGVVSSSGAKATAVSNSAGVKNGSESRSRPKVAGIAPAPVPSVDGGGRPTSFYV